MGFTVKHLKKVAVKIEAVPQVYGAPDVLLPYTTFTVQQNFDPVVDESLIGQAFADLPLQGARHVIGNLSGQVDLNTIGVLLEAAYGAVAAGVYTAPTTENTKTLSIVAIDAVKTYKWAGCVLNNLVLTSEGSGDLTFSADVIGTVAEVRDGTAFPTIVTNPGTRLLHRHASGSGHFRIGDQDNALASGDDLGLRTISFGINFNFAEAFDNEGQGAMLGVSGEAGRPVATFSATISRHEVDTPLTWRDDIEALQAELLYYSSAAKQLKIEIPNFILTAAMPDDAEVAQVPLETVLARNGIGTSYSNANMAFNSPIRITVTNS